MPAPEQPIGIFDSGLGGLTVTHALKQLLPNEHVIYFGDTKHLPYGDKSAESIKYYSTHITGFLLDQGCKMVLVACNTASATAYEDVIAKVGEKALVMNVIEPVIDHVTLSDASFTLGVIGTKGTITSKTYENNIREKKPGVTVKSMATPLLVPMIEEGFIYDDISNAIIRNYLSREEISGIDKLILGCTHYPIIKNQIRKYYNFQVDIIDSATVVAAAVKAMLEKHQLLNQEKTHDGHYFVSDYTGYFSAIARMFFEEDIHLEKLDIWSKE
ncbi:MAG: glutamate racemase [Bacteroidales bacterium]